MPTVPTLNPGDRVEIIAPASRCAYEQLAQIKDFISSWQLDCILAEDIFGPDLLCANSDEARLKHLKKALQSPDTKAIICARGGYGSMRLIPYLAKMPKPIHYKIFVGMSDTTALQLFMQQQWSWPSIHGGLIPGRFSEDSIAQLKALLFGQKNIIEFSTLSPLNAAAMKERTIETSITGGNLCLVQSGIGTLWQMDAKNKIILLEETGERGYRIDRMFEHLRQANIFQEAAAILLGDFLGGAEPDGTSLIQPVLARFAENADIPVVKVKGIGHGRTNFPLFLGTKARLVLGQNAKLSCSREQCLPEDVY